MMRAAIGATLGESPWRVQVSAHPPTRSAPMMSKSMQDALNEQMKHEFYSSYLYLSMSAYCDAMNLPGLSRWMRAQAQEEAKHAMKIFDHILDRGGRISLEQIDRPPAQFTSPGEVFDQAHRHEQQVTASINRVYGLAMDERDFASKVFLDWFVQEQVEEEKTSGLLAEQLRMVGEDRPGLLMLDRDLGQRRTGAVGTTADAT
jgi:ferritin